MSKNGIALTIMVVEALLTSVGIEFEPGSVTKAVEGLLVAGALILALWNQYNREDVQLFLFKK